MPDPAEFPAAGSGHRDDEARRRTACAQRTEQQIRAIVRDEIARNNEAANREAVRLLLGQS